MADFFTEGDAGSSKGGSGGLKKRVGPLSVGGWAASLGGAFVLFIVFKRHEASKAASAGGTSGLGSSTLTAGGTVPLPGGAQTTGPTAFASYGAWLQAAIDAMSNNGLDPGQALNGITDWLGGQCVSSAQYSGITSAISGDIGLPPGYGSALPPLSVCAAPSAGNPSPPTPSPVAAAQQVLAEINAATWPQIVKFGQDANAGTDFVPIGVVNNGVYSGKAAQAGAPVWAGVYGGYAQGFNESTLPNGTILYGASQLANQGYYA